MNLENQCFENNREYNSINSNKVSDFANNIVERNRELLTKMKSKSSSAAIIINFNVSNGMIQYQMEVVD